MLQTEYIRNLQCNYERILLEQKPEEKRYQYCILNRGGIKGLLPCSLRYINGQAYLYYDITSKQKVSQLFDRKQVTRGWMLEFLWNFQRLQQELSRFLLDISNVIWYPEQIFQDLESKTFSFLYVPYFEEYNGFMNLVDFWIEHLDYNDESLVEFVYQVHEQLENHGEQYLQKQLFADAEKLESKNQPKPEEQGMEEAVTEKAVMTSEGMAEEMGDTGETAGTETIVDSKEKGVEKETIKETTKEMANGAIIQMTGKAEQTNRKETQPKEGIMPQNASYEYDKNKKEITEEKRGILKIFEERKQGSKRKKNREERENYRNNMQTSMAGYAVAEGVVYNYEEEYGRTIYVEEAQSGKKPPHLLYSSGGKLLASIEKDTFTVGKKKEEADLILDDASVSRMHARLIKEGDEVYLEDLNSTNGTYKNGLRLEPYERRKLEEEDEIKCGNVTLIFR